jgi:hypothetical protein
VKLDLLVSSVTRVDGCKAADDEDLGVDNDDPWDDWGGRVGCESDHRGEGECSGRHLRLDR